MPLPGVIMSARFVNPNSRVFAGYLDYMDRSAAERNDMTELWDATNPVNQAGSSVMASDDKTFGGMTDYMKNPEKTDDLFGARGDRLSEGEVQALKSYFKEGQTAGSPMWQMVFSFDNNWLAEQGLYDGKQQLNKAKIRDATRHAMAELEKNTGLKGQWTAAIHYNTDNLHVHVAYVEREPTREKIYYLDPNHIEYSGWQYKGKFRADELKRVKSAFSNTLTNNQIMLKKLDQVLNETITNAREMSQGWYGEVYQGAIDQLKKSLPKDTRKWQYGYANGQHFKPQIDAAINAYLNHDGAIYVPRIKQALAEAESVYKRQYGQTKASYRENKLYGKDGLYSRLGNAVLKQLKSDQTAEQTKTSPKVDENPADMPNQKMGPEDVERYVRTKLEIKAKYVVKAKARVQQGKRSGRIFDVSKNEIDRLSRAHRRDQLGLTDKVGLEKLRWGMTDTTEIVGDPEQAYWEKYALGPSETKQARLHDQATQRPKESMQSSRQNPTQFSRPRPVSVRRDRAQPTLSRHETYLRQRAYYERHQSVLATIAPIQKYLGQSTDDWLQKLAYERVEEAEERTKTTSEKF